MANKLLKPKRGKVENLSKLAVEDGALVFAYDTKATTSTVLVDIGDIRYDLAAGAAKKADNANALGGSSLQNIIDKIDSSTGDGTAFTGLDTAINNKVKLTRANGSTIEKTINNVSNASTADYSKVSGKIGTGTVGSSTKPVYINNGIPTAITSIPSTFIEAQQINNINLDTLFTPGMYWTQGRNNITNKPTGIDAFGLEVVKVAAEWYAQICYASDEQEKQFVRYYNSTSWTDWVEQNRLNTKTQSGYAPAPNAANKVYRTDASGNPGWGTLNDSSIGKLASTVTLGDGNDAMIDQNGTTYRQRINIFDNATANDAVFSFQQSTNAGKTYKDLFAINDNGTVVASTFQGALKGTADYSKSSGALGGSSLQNIVDKINNSTGDGTAFTGLDTTTNNKVKLTRANGGTVEKTINNVSNASTADYSKNSSALEGSSLKNIVDKINNSTGDGTAFTELDTTTNNVIKLTRANGATIQKTINNVAKASIADRLTMEAGTADVARNVWFSDSGARDKAVYNDNFKYNPVKNSLTTNITGEAASANYAKGGESESNYQLNSTQLHETIDLTSSTYNQNTWYPVVGSSLPYRGYSRIICYVQLNSGTKPSWSTHGSGFTCNLDVLAKAGGWGTTNAGTIVLDYSWSFTQDNVSPISYQQLTNSSCPVIWMRGGGKYFIRSSEKFTWTVKTSSYTVSSQTVAPQTSCPALSLTRSTIYANINGSVASADSATNASTAEYAKNAGKLGGVEASKYAKKEDIPAIPSNLDVANRLQSYQSAGNIPNSLFYRYGKLDSSWSNFPASSLPSTGIGANFQGKNTGVLHVAAGSSYHDLAFTAGAKDNQGILYAGTGRNPAYILDTENYKTKGNVFNSLTANTSFTAKVNVTIDGGSY